jgi:glycosyltransferase involved in cell wall biosynthesis
MNEWALKTPVVLTFFDMQEAFLPKFFPFRERMARSVAHRRGVRKAEVVIAPSEFTAESLRRRYGTPPRKIRRIPAGVSDAFHPGDVPGERERVTQRYGIPRDGFLLYPANPWPHKNHQRLLAALRRLSGRWGRAVPLVCTGKLAGERRSVLEMAKAAELDSQVHDLGFVPEDDMPALYRSARLTVFPSLFEGFGMPVLEAMASGCPVACASSTSLPEVGGDAVRYFDPTDEAGLLEAMAELWQDERQRTSLRQRGLERAREFRWDRILPRVLEAYSCAAASNPRARSNSSGSGRHGQASQAPRDRSSSTE